MAYLKCPCPMCTNPRVSPSTLKCKCGAEWKTEKEFYDQGFKILHTLGMVRMKTAKKSPEDYLDAIEKLHMAYNYLKNREMS